MDIEKKDISDIRRFVDEAGVDTRTKIKALGNIPPEREGVTVCLRIPKDVELWLNERVNGNKSLAVTAMLDRSIELIEAELLKKGTFNAKRWLKVVD